MEKVAIRRCASYQYDDIDACLTSCFRTLGGLESFISPDDKILIKPNLLSAHSPDKAITTHPALVEAVIRKILDITNNIENLLLADSFGPTSPYNPEELDKLYKATGMDIVSKNTGVRLNYDVSAINVSNKNAKIIKKLDIISPVFWADKIINLAKFKTHDLMVLTGAVKNMFGIIPGITKPAFHLSFSDRKNFADILLDIAYFKKPVLSIMDGILGMEGNGPGRNGTPRYLNMLLASADPVALDTVFSKIAGVQTQDNPVLFAAKNRSFPGAELKEIELGGIDLDDFIIKDFDVPLGSFNDKILSNRFLQLFILPFLKNTLNPLPYTIHTMCTQCNVCVNICPAKAIQLHKGKIIYDYHKCIRCFCCSEMCPEGAISNKYSFLSNFVLNKSRMAIKR